MQNNHPGTQHCSMCHVRFSLVTCIGVQGQLNEATDDNVAQDKKDSSSIRCAPVVCF